MKAVIFTGPHKPLIVDEVEIDRPIGQEVLIKVAACGVCHSDLHYVEGLYPARIPILLGHEGAGIIEEVGPDVRHLKPGDHVILLPVMFCGRCKPCQSGFPTMCTDRESTRRRPDEKPRTTWKGEFIGPNADGGAFAEKMLCHQNGVSKIPDDVPLDRAALIGCAVITGAGAVLNTAGVRAGQTVAVFGCGGIGLSAVQAARIAGARKVIAVDTLENKLASARRLGATDTIDASSSDPVKAIAELTEGGVDCAIEAVGLKKTAEQAFHSLGIGGTAVIVGMVPFGQKLEIAPHLLGLGRKLTGCILGNTRFHVDAPNYVEFYRKGLLNLDDMVTRHCRLEEINEAFQMIKNGEVIRSVVVFD